MDSASQVLNPTPKHRLNRYSAYNSTIVTRNHGPSRSSVKHQKGSTLSSNARATPERLHPFFIELRPLVHRLAIPFQKLLSFLGAPR